MTLPRGFSTAVAAAGQNWKLVPGGTSAVVVCCQGTAGLRSFLTNEIVDPCISARAEEKNWLDESLGENATFYVKVRTLATENHFAQAPWTYWHSNVETAVNLHGGTGVEEVKSEVGDGPDEETSSQDFRQLYEDYLRTYPRCPVQGFRGESYAVLMNDRGSVRLDYSTSLEETSEAAFANRLWRLWQATIQLSKRLKVWHGDVADFNIVFDPQNPNEYVLIDWDEATEIPRSRDTTNLGGELKHHEDLRNKPELYTDVQFSLTFCQLHVERYNNKETWGVSNEKLLEDFRGAIESKETTWVVEEAKNFVRKVKDKIKDIRSSLPRDQLL